MKQFIYRVTEATIKKVELISKDNKFVKYADEVPAGKEISSSLINGVRIQFRDTLPEAINQAKVNAAKRIHSLNSEIARIQADLLKLDKLKK